jgi:hypothetical protein
MAVSIADQTLFFSNLYGRITRGLRGVKISGLSSCPFDSQNIKYRGFFFLGYFPFIFLCDSLPLDLYAMTLSGMKKKTGKFCSNTQVLENFGKKAQWQC